MSVSIQSKLAVFLTLAGLLVGGLLNTSYASYVRCFYDDYGYRVCQRFYDDYYDDYYYNNYYPSWFGLGLFGTGIGFIDGHHHRHFHGAFPNRGFRVGGFPSGGFHGGGLRVGGFPGGGFHGGGLRGGGFHGGGFHFGGHR